MTNIFDRHLHCGHPFIWIFSINCLGSISKLTLSFWGITRTTSRGSLTQLLIVYLFIQLTFVCIRPTHGMCLVTTQTLTKGKSWLLKESLGQWTSKLPTITSAALPLHFLLNFHHARLKHKVYFNFSIYLNHKQMQLHHSQLLQ